MGTGEGFDEHIKKCHEKIHLSERFDMELRNVQLLFFFKKNPFTCEFHTEERGRVGERCGDFLGGFGRRRWCGENEEGTLPTYPPSWDLRKPSGKEEEEGMVPNIGIFPSSWIRSLGDWQIPLFPSYPFGLPAYLGGGSYTHFFAHKRMSDMAVS